MAVATGNGGGNPIDDDQFTLMLIGIFAWPALAGAALWAWNQGGSWLVKHQILVSAKAGPLITIPGMNGAGLDTTRVVITVGALLVLTAITAAGIRRAIAVRRASAVV